MKHNGLGMSSSSHELDCFIDKPAVWQDGTTLFFTFYFGG